MWECGCGRVSVSVDVHGGAILTLHAFCVCADLCVVWCEIMRFTGAHFQRERVRALHRGDTECAG